MSEPDPILYVLRHNCPRCQASSGSLANRPKAARRSTFPGWTGRGAAGQVIAVQAANKPKEKSILTPSTNPAILFLSKRLISQKGGTHEKNPHPTPMAPGPNPPLSGHPGPRPAANLQRRKRLNSVHKDGAFILKITFP